MNDGTPMYAMMVPWTPPIAAPINEADDHGDRPR